MPKENSKTRGYQSYENYDFKEEEEIMEHEGQGLPSTN
jgi:hypothetical protein